jgi:hypothetical protein
MKNSKPKGHGPRQMPTTTTKVVTGSDRLQKGANVPSKGGKRS